MGRGSLLNENRQPFGWLFAYLAGQDGAYVTLTPKRVTKKILHFVQNDSLMSF